MIRVNLLANGNIQFNDNQVVFDSLSPAVTLSLSSILLLSLDDISIQDNQCDCDLLFDFVGIHALAIGWSVRMLGNRFKEPILLNQNDDVRGFAHTFLSGMTLGVYNDTSHNQGGHCFLAVGRERLLVSSVLDTNRHGVSDDFCEPFLIQRDPIGRAAGFPKAQIAARPR